MNRDRLRATLARDEGLNLRRHDVNDIEHIGYGFNLEIEWHDGLLEYLGVLGEDEIQELTQEQADYILDWHITDIQSTIAKRFPAFNMLSPLRQEIIMNMRFNLGSGGLRKFKKMWTAIENEDWKQASVQMLDSLWAKQVGNRAIRLSNAFASDNEKSLELGTMYDTYTLSLDQKDTPLAGATNQELIDEIARRMGKI